ncbi:BZ3500_MvSof-1268-A1-R1_Chr3-3g06569 [Microbotryum saponariae]|uniref:BZ3500_MvSof-1268-A1-R1_Chr3-3g06569 protein n=1 Tax=Microbotryum saponariae TaxID=289078 RepID=A0A2X0N0J9_9BASI|nr:BZ3500_MvSof-1268-A1-R1_Chr3-3g06569 [Microbotryum saponariae]SDA04536.1 BZ3501_MvSof-1269-A2-R1_Chr3-2g06256 [Microbotryum saponariae]
MSSTTSTQKKDLGQREPDIIDQSPSVTHSNQISMTPEGCSDDVDSNADSDPAVDDSEASSSDGGKEAMDRLRQVVNLLENCAPNHLQLEYDTMQAKRQAIMSSNLLWSAEEKADYGQWPLILGDRRKADKWTLKDTIPIFKLPLYMATEEAKLTKFFLTDPPPILHWRNQPEQEHEWTACKYERCLAVAETSHGAPSISFHQHPADHLTLIEWHPLIGHNLQSTWKESLKEVLRISHQCSGACMRYTGDDGKIYYNVRPKDKDVVRECSSQLKIVVPASNLSIALIYTLGNHEGPRTLESVRKPAAVMRTVAHQIVQQCGSTRSIMSDYCKKWEKIHRVTLHPNRVIWAKQLKSMFRTKAAKAFQPLNATNNESLICVLASLHSIDILIAFATMGNVAEDGSRFLGIDSSWRYLNENRARLPFLRRWVRTNRWRWFSHILFSVGPMLLSSDVKQGTLLHYLDVVKDLVEKRATIIVRDAQRGSVSEPPGNLPNLLENAQYIVQHQWQPPNLMIDKCRTELGALKQWASRHGLEFQIRLCQFHAIQAITRWSTDATQASKTDRSPVSKPILVHILRDSRSIIQRFRFVRGPHETEEQANVRRRQEFDARAQTFLTRTDAWILKSHSSDETSTTDVGKAKIKKLQQQVRDYFTQNWFVDAWIETFVDDGLPLGVARDDINTNNITERAFKRIQQEHLQGRANKRALIYDILKDVTIATPNADLRRILAKALDIWEMGVFQQTKKSYAWVVSAGFRPVRQALPHLWAVDLLVNNGPYHTVMKEQARAAMDLKGALHDDIPRSKVRDSTIEMVVNCAINENLAIDDLHGSLSEEDDEDDSSGESEADESEAEIDIGNRAGVDMKAATSRGPSPKNKPLQPGRSIKKPKGRSKKKTRLNVTEDVQGATSPTIKSAPHLEHTGRRNGHADKLLESLLRDKLNPASLRTKTAKDKPFADEAFSKTRGRRPETKPSNSLIGTKHHQAAKEITDYLTILECLDIACSDQALSDDQKPACPCPPLVEGMLEPSIYATVDPDDRMANVTNIQGVVGSIKHPYTASRQDRFPWMIHLDVHQNAYYVPGLNLRTLATLNDPEKWVSSAHIDAFVTAINRFGGQAAMREDQRSAASDWTPTVYGFHPLKDFGEDIGGKNPTNRHPGRFYFQSICPVIGCLLRPVCPTTPSASMTRCGDLKKAEKRLNIVPFLTARAEGPIPRVTGGSDRPTVPYAEWERVIVKPRVPKKGDLMPRTEFTRQPDGNACGVFVCRTMETLVAAVAFQSELDWSWSPLKPLQDNFNADQRAYMLDVVIHARLRCDTELEANYDPPPLDLREGTGAPPPLPESVPLALKESSPELEEKPLGSPGIEFCAPTLVLVDPSIGTIPRPNPAPSIATIGSMPDAPPMRLPRVVRFDPTPPLLVSEALEVVACLPRYQTRTLAVRSIAAISKSAPSPRRSKRKREESFFKAARLR